MPSPAPNCAGVCDEFIRGEMAARGIEAHVTHMPPVFKTNWEALNMRCTHGVLWFTEPTSEQVARWAKDGVA